MKNGQHSELKEILDNDNLFLKFYSTSHITDIFSSFKETKQQRRLIDSDLEFISQITKNKCLYNSTDGKMIAGDYDPKELFQERVEQKDLFNDISIDGLSELFNSSEVGKKLGIPIMESLKNIQLDPSFKAAFEKPESKEMMNRLFPGLKDNLTMEGWFNYFNKMLKGLNDGEDYKELRNIVQESTNLNRDKIFNNSDPYSFLYKHYKKFGGERKTPLLESKHSPEWFDEISNEYIQLDMHGYQEDKVKINKGRKETFQNTTEDSFHAAFASTCDFYLVNDKKAFNKTSKVYDELKINTWTQKPKEFIDHYKKFLSSRDYKLHLQIFMDLISSNNFIEQQTDSGKLYTMYPPIYLFDFFNKIVRFEGDDGAKLTYLSQNKPTNYFVTFLEIKNLVQRLEEFFGLDKDGSGELTKDEFYKEEWKKRVWSINESLSLRFQANNYHAQLYFDIGKEPAGNNG
ncbi:hypothetical protein ML462_06300 [Gramella lutea]|uniref:EF-hand domain-containing protein n=1 Tax=Christiangramia lutea TaxID=1607951 RepID=A0A9X2AB50_9FLAO|nr:hypothetical protein [Christiangramia lutea]MCH4822778.1 hypothetical protein [Christiangramia lutea]